MTDSDSGRESSLSGAQAFENIKRLGLIIMKSHWAGHAEGHEWQYAVSAADLEALLAKGVRVYGYEGMPPKEYGWSVSCVSGDTHTALLIGIAPKKSEIDEAAESLNALIKGATAIIDEAKRLLGEK